jgi:hypothetical protein
MYNYYDPVTFEFLVSVENQLNKENTHFTNVDIITYDNNIEKLFWDGENNQWVVRDIIMNGYYAKIDNNNFIKITQIVNSPTSKDVINNKYIPLFNALDIIQNSIISYYNELRFFKAVKGNISVEFVCKPDDVTINTNKIWGFTTLNNNVKNAINNGDNTYIYYVDTNTVLSIPVVNLQELAKQMNKFHISTGTLIRLHIANYVTSLYSNLQANGIVSSLLNYDYRLEIRKEVLGDNEPWVVVKFPDQAF